MFSIKTERKDSITINKNQLKDIERLLRKAKLENDKVKIKAFAELLYSERLIESEENKEYYLLLILNKGLRKVQNLSKEIDEIRKTLIDNSSYFEYEINYSNDLFIEDVNTIQINETEKIKELMEQEDYMANYPEELDGNFSDLINSKFCKFNEKILEILKTLKIKFRVKKIESYKTRAKNSIRKALCELVIWLKQYKSIAMFSGGKDSTAMIIKLIEEGEKLDRIIFADTELEFPEMYRYIERVENYIGRKIDIVKGKNSFDDWFYGTWTKGKNKGEIRGFPKVVGLGCWAKRELKIKPLQQAEGKGNVIYIGIAADEKERMYRENYQHTNIYRLPLVEYNMSEMDCLNMLKERNLENPLYDIFKRLGCWLCPKQGLKSLKNLYLNYPDLWEQLKKYEKDSPTGFKIDTKLIDLEKRFLIEKQQISIFDLAI